MHHLPTLVLLCIYHTQKRINQNARWIDLSGCRLRPSRWLDDGGGMNAGKG